MRNPIPVVRVPAALVTAALVTALAVPHSAAAQDWRTVSQSRQVGPENSLALDIEYAAGQLRFGPAPAGTLYRMGMRYDAEVFSPDVAFRGNRLRVGMDDAQIRGRDMRSGQLDLHVTPDLPIDLELAFGAAQADIDLGGLQVRRAQIQTGASTTKLTVSQPNPGECRSMSLELGAARFEATRLGNLNTQRISVEGGVGDVTLDFSGEWRRDMSATIKMGLGQLTLAFPRGLGVRVRKGGLLSPFDGQGLVKRGDVYYSEDWETADHKLSIDLDAAFGSIKVVWLD